jgi:hypothetical protein
MRISPIITNSGTATRMELEFTFQAICPIMSHSGRSEKRYIRMMPISPRAPATCSPARKNTGGCQTRRRGVRFSAWQFKGQMSWSLGATL